MAKKKEEILEERLMKAQIDVTFSFKVKDFITFCEILKVDSPRLWKSLGPKLEKAFDKAVEEL